MRIKMKSFMVCVLLCFVVDVGFSQGLLMLEDAIGKALESNYDIKLEKYNVEISKNNISRAVSGQMPAVELNGSYEWGYAEAETQTIGLTPGEGNGNPIELDGSSRELLL